MSGTIYDLSPLIYTEDGKIYQIEYANKRVEDSESMVGVECKDGIVLAIEKKKHSILLEADANNRIFLVQRNIALMMNGNIPDGKNVYRRAVSESENYKKNYGINISVELLAERISLYLHAHTMHGGYRPLACSIILAGVEEHNRNINTNMGNYNKIFMIQPSGELMKFFGCSSGKNKIFTQGEIEKNKFKNLTIEESLPLITKTFLKSHEEVNDSYFEMEIKTIKNDSNIFEKVDTEKVEKLMEQAHEMLDNE